MADSASQPQLPRERRRLSCGMMALGCFGTAIGLLLLLAIGVWLYSRREHYQALADVRDEVARIQAAGEPITTEDMFAFHRVPKGVIDTTPQWVLAGQLAFAADHPEKRRLPIVGEQKWEDLSLDVSLLPLSEQFLKANSAAVEAIQAAAAAEGECRYPIDFSQGINAQLDHVQNSRAMARILSLRLHVATARGQTEVAIESLRLQLEVVNSLEHEPTIVTQLVRQAVLKMAISDLRFLVNELPLADQQLLDLQQRLARIDIRGPIKEGLIGERAMGFHAFHNMSVLEQSKQKDLAQYDGTLVRPADCRLHLNVMRELIIAADEPPRQGRARAKRAIDQVESKAHSKNPLIKLEVIVTALLVPAIEFVFESTARAEAMRDSAVAGIAFRRYQLKHNNPPPTLESLVPAFLPAMPADPFAEETLPLKLLIEKEHFAIYSVGQNLADDRALLTDPESDADDGFVARLYVPDAGRGFDSNIGDPGDYGRNE